MSGRHRDSRLWVVLNYIGFGWLANLRLLPVIAALSVLAVLGVAVSRTLAIGGSDSQAAVTEEDEEFDEDESFAPTPVNSPSPVKSVGLLPPTQRPSASPAPAPLSAKYATSATFDGGYVGQVTITNAGGAPQAWKVNLTMPPGVTITNVWGAMVQRTGQAYQITAVGAAPLAGGSTYSIGFQATRGTGPYQPTTCAINDRICA